MKKIKFLGVGIVLLLLVAIIVLWKSPTNQTHFLIDSFEGEVSRKTVDFGSSNNSFLEASASKDKKYCGKQSMKIVYELEANGYLYCARGFGLDVLGATWEGSEPGKIDWNQYKGFSFYLHGDNKGLIAFDIKDGGGEMWRYLFMDDFKGWGKIVIPFDKFSVRDDWQPSTADGNKELNFPIRSFQWEPRIEGKGTLYFDCVRLEKDLDVQ